MLKNTNQGASPGETRPSNEQRPQLQPIYHAIGCTFSQAQACPTVCKVKICPSLVCWLLQLVIGPPSAGPPSAASSGAVTRQRVVRVDVNPLGESAARIIVPAPVVCPSARLFDELAADIRQPIWRYLAGLGEAIRSNDRLARCGREGAGFLAANDGHAIQPPRCDTCRHSCGLRVAEPIRVQAEGFTRGARVLPQTVLRVVVDKIACQIGGIIRHVLANPSEPI